MEIIINIVKNSIKIAVNACIVTVVIVITIPVLIIDWAFKEEINENRDLRSGD